MTFLQRIPKKLIEQVAIPAQKRPGLILLLLSLLFALVAQTVLDLSAADQLGYWNISTWLITLGNNSSPLLGLTTYLLAGALFVRGIHLLSRPTSAAIYPIATLAPERAAPRFGFWLTSLGLAALTFIHNLNATQPGYSNSAEILLWLLSISLFSYTVLSDVGFTLPGIKAMKEWLAANWRELLVIAISLCGVLLLRVIDLEAHPFAFANDEGEMGKMGLRLLYGTCSRFFIAQWAFQPTLAFLPTAISVGLLGNTAFAVRFVSAITGMLAVLFAYLFTRETFGKQTAWVAAILAATFPPHLHFSRLGFDNIIDSLSSALMMWLIFRGARKGTPVYYLAAGIVAGLCFYTYPGSRLTPIIALGALAWIALRTPHFLRAQWRNLLIFLVAALIVVAPIAGHFIATPQNFMARLERESIFVNGPWQAQNDITFSNATQVMGEQILKSSLVFIATGGPLQFFNTPRPYFAPVAAILFMLGLAIVISRLSQTHSMALFAWFWAPVIIGSALTVGAPSHQRMLGSSMPAVIIAAVGLLAILNALEKINPMTRRLVAPLLLILTLLFNGATDIQYYFGEYRLGHYNEDLSNEITYESRLYITPLGDNGRLYLIGSPMTYTKFGNFAYFSPKVEKIDFNDISRENLATLPKDKDALFLAIPAREADLKTIATWIPGGEWTAEQRRYLPQSPLFFAYKVTKEQLQGFQP